MFLIITSEKGGPCIIYTEVSCPKGLNVTCRWNINTSLPPQSSLPLTCLASTEGGMELHVDISNDSGHSIFESEWMDISFTLGQHWCIRPPVLNNPPLSLFLFLSLELLVSVFVHCFTAHLLQPESPWRFIFCNLLMTCTNNPFGILEQATPSWKSSGPMGSVNSVNRQAWAMTTSSFGNESNGIRPV